MFIPRADDYWGYINGHSCFMELGKQRSMNENEISMSIATALITHLNQQTRHQAAFVEHYTVLHNAS